jgi:hypothetical protein
LILIKSTFNKFVCHGGLPIYVAYVANLLDIHIIKKEDEMPPHEKPKKIMTFRTSVEMCGLLNSHG